MFVSNTGISLSHNKFITLKKGELVTFRALLRPVVPGKLTWRFRYSHTVDSTWADGSESRANIPGGRFEIVASTAGAADENTVVGEFLPVTWPEAVVEPAACIESAPIELDISEGGYVAFSWCVRALEDDCVLPATQDSQSLCWTQPGNKTLSPANPFDCSFVMLPDAFEADRDVKLKMVFMGDSITQGCGTGINTYSAWATRIIMGMQQDVSGWNIGLGFGRAEDAALGGAWLSKAKQADVVNLCFGVNDLLSGQRTADEVIAFLKTAVDALHAAKVKVVLFTVPPFDLHCDEEKYWRAINARIREDALGADFMFDFAALLGRSAPEDNLTIFGGHPDGRGGALVAGDYLSRFWPLVLRPALLNK